MNCDAVVAPFDVLLIINYLNQQGAGPLTVPLTPADFPAPFYDVNGDDLASPIDALLIVNFLNSRSSGGEGEAEQAVAFGEFLPGQSSILFVPVVEQLDASPRTQPDSQ